MDADTKLGPFLTGVASWFGSFGLHSVLFSTLLVVELGESEVRVGIAQSAIMIPAVVLMLWGGAVADRANQRQLLMALHAAGFALALSLALALLAGHLSYGLLLAYAVGMGTIQAFVNPTRDAMLSKVVVGDLGRPVAQVNLTQWGSQALGATLGASARWLGTTPLFGAQALILLSGALAFWRLPETPAPQDPRVREFSLGELTGGIREVLHSPVLRPTWLMTCAVGVLFIGPFMVVFPLMVRDVYGGGGPQIAMISTAFPVGTIVGSLLVMRYGGIRRKLRAQRLALVVGAANLLGIALGLPFWAVCLLVSVWGAGAAVFMIAGRTLFQEWASEENRGRVLAAYSMAFVGAAGLAGAPLSGLLVGAFGPREALAIQACAMLVVVAVLTLASRGSDPESSDF